MILLVADLGIAMLNDAFIPNKSQLYGTTMYTIYIIFVYNNGISRLNIFTGVVNLYLITLLILNI